MTTKKSLTPPSPKGLSDIQKDFDRYQSSAFAQREPQFFALELAGECGELANLEKKLWRDPSNPKPFETLADEAADVFIALMNYTNSRKMNLQDAVEKKLVRIEERRLQGLMGKTRDEQ